MKYGNIKRNQRELNTKDALVPGKAQMAVPTGEICMELCLKGLCKETNSGT